MVDPERGRLLALGNAASAVPQVSWYYGFSGPIGAGGQDRAASVQVAAGSFIQMGGAVSGSALPQDGIAEIADSATYGPVADRSGIVDLQVRAADGQRPYLRLTQDWKLDSGAAVESTLILDGLWIGTEKPHSVILLGDYEEVALRSTHARSRR